MIALYLVPGVRREHLSNSEPDYDYLFCFFLRQYQSFPLSPNFPSVWRIRVKCKLYIDSKERGSLYRLSMVKCYKGT
jgi:hypothetical protein